jgi:hypothetical protein
MRRTGVLIATLLFASTLSATVLLPAEFREIVAGSDIIAHVRVVDVRPEWADGRRRVESVVSAEVITSLKGGSGPTLEFKVPGGQLGRYQTVMIGAPVFERGDEAVLFLRSGDSDQLPTVFGLNQGVFRVRVDSRTGQSLVVPPPLMATPTGSTAQLVRRGSLDRRPLPVNAFGARVREAMASQPGRAR